MKGQLFLLLFAIFQCTWAGQSEAGKSDGCTELMNRIHFNDIKTCTTLSGPNENRGLERAELMINGEIDNGKWNEFTSKLTGFTRVDVIIQNSTIKKIHLPKFTTSSKSLLVVKNNPVLEEVFIHIGGAVTFDGFTVSENPKLKAIKVSVVPPGILTVVGGELIVRENDELTLIESAMNSNLWGIKGLYIQGNRHLQKSSLDHFKLFRAVAAMNKLVKGPIVIQEEGECIFKNKIHDLAELKGCKYVNSDLKMGPDVGGEATGVHLANVSGEIHLGNLRPDKLGFLKKTQVREGQIKSDSCEFTLETDPVYENKQKCPPSVNNQPKVVYPLLYGLGIGGGILFVAGLVGLLVYCFWWKKKPNKKSKESSKSKSSESGKKSSTSSNRGK